MNDFTASNGAKFFRDHSGELQMVTDRGPNFIVANAELALREFFQAESDERLGRWRWPENPSVVVVPDLDGYHDDGKRWVAVYDETQMGRSSWYCADASGRGIRGSQPLHDAAWAYFDAHPEPKPEWHNAKPGELWELAELEPALYIVESSGTRFIHVERRLFALDIEDPCITSGRRIWPEEVAS
jgi:hypothetical protein